MLLRLLVTRPRALLPVDVVLERQAGVRKVHVIPAVWGVPNKLRSNLRRRVLPPRPERVLQIQLARPVHAEFRIVVQICSPVRMKLPSKCSEANWQTFRLEREDVELTLLVGTVIQLSVLQPTGAISARRHDLSIISSLGRRGRARLLSVMSYDGRRPANAKRSTRARAARFKHENSFRAQLSSVLHAAS